MSSSKHACAAAFLLCATLLLGGTTGAIGQTNYFATSGTEYAVAGSLPGDQMFPDVDLNPSGGYVVWQDNVTDGNGWGISAERLNSTFSGTLSSFRVNVQGTNNQINPKVANLKNGGAAFVWQGGAVGHTQIFARFLSPTNTWLSTTDLVVGVFTNSFQVTPALTVLNDGNVVVVWSSFNRAGSSTLLDVYGAILSPSGQTVSNAFLINQFTAYNQRTPTVTALAGGGFAVAWVSEQQQSLAPNLGSNTVLQAASAVALPSVDIYGRMFQSNGVALSNEFLINVTGKPASSPVLSAASNGGFLAVWSAHDMETPSNGWDIIARPFSSTGTPGNPVMVNTYTYGDQYAPKVSSIGSDFMVVWTSLGQDGSREGVYGQFVHGSGDLVGSEFRVNTTTQGQQMQASVASDGSAWFQVVWTSFGGLPNGFELNGQRFADTAAILQPMSAPFVYAPFNLVNNQYVPELIVSWPGLPGVSVANFQIFLNGSTTPTNVSGTTNLWVMTPANGLTSQSTNSFQIGYVTTGGSTSPISASARGVTWSGANWFGIPIEWMESYYGLNAGSWPLNVNAKLTPGGLSLYDVFLSGGNPLLSSTWLSQTIVRTPQGIFLDWNTQAGMTYQVQQSSTLGVWSNLGAPRFAAGTNDSLYLGTGSKGFYRVLLISQ